MGQLLRFLYFHFLSLVLIELYFFVWLGTQSTLLGLGNHVLSYNSCFSYCRHGKKSVLDSNLVQ